MSERLPALGFIGAGVMGRAMIGHLLKAGHPMRIHTRTRSRAGPLIAAGAVWAETPVEVAQGADVVISIVSMPADVRAVWLGPVGALKMMKAGAIGVDMTTSSPALAVEIHDAAKARGVAMLDAPVTGGDLGAREARLSILAGGPREAFDRMKPIFEKLGTTIRHFGGPGAGQRCKLCNQIVIAGTMIGMVEGLYYAKRAGLDPAEVLEGIGAGAAGSWSLTHLAPRILRDDLEPGFMIEHFIKDLELALEECRRLNLHLRGLELVHRFYRALKAHGHERKGTQALILALEKGLGPHPV
ncbi:MAG: NAD(P)-dependent oxidoreductase [Verrucomicrobiae bacterium]|nr:NAD(P)-dependent oxidoreductase [Verrucomicrobiae bacterium]